MRKALIFFIALCAVFFIYNPVYSEEFEVFGELALTEDLNKDFSELNTKAKLKMLFCLRDISVQMKRNGVYYAEVPYDFHKIRIHVFDTETELRTNHKKFILPHKNKKKEIDTEVFYPAFVCLKSFIHKTVKYESGNLFKDTKITKISAKDIIFLQNIAGLDSESFKTMSKGSERFTRLRRIVDKMVKAKIHYIKVDFGSSSIRIHAEDKTGRTILRKSLDGSNSQHSAIEC